MPSSVLGRLGRWCFRRRWWVLAVWLVAIVVGGLSFGPVFSRLVDDNGGPKSLESVQAGNVVGQGTQSAGTINGIISGVDPTSPAVQSAVAATAAQLGTLPSVTRVVDPYTDGLTGAQRAAMQSVDGHSIAMLITLGDLDRAGRDKAIDDVSGPLRALPAALPPGASVQVGGNPVLNRDVNRAVQVDLATAEEVSLPLTLILLIVIFGGLAAAGLPVLAAIVSVAASMAVLLGFTMFTDIDQNAVTVTTLLGLGLSIDYGLLLVSRYREELALGFDRDVAVARAWATAGRTILFSALTVAAAMAGMLTFGISTFSALGAAGVSIAVVAMLAALTFTAAMLGVVKRFVKPSRKALRRASLAQSDDEHGFFARLSRMVQRRPVTITVATGVLLLAAGAPLLSTNLKLPQLEGIPRSIEAARVADIQAAQFRQPARPAITVVARTDPSTLDTWAAQWRTQPGVAQVRPANSAGNGVSTVAVDMVGDAQGSQARDLVAQMRSHRPTGYQIWVGGDAGVLVDVLHLIAQGLPMALAVVLIGMFVLLFLFTGSVVVPIKAILANVISLGATLGVMTAVFDKGIGSGVLHTLTIGGLSPFVLVIVFSFAFGLSMDYEVFLLGRIKEYVDAGMDTDTAVRRGLQHTGRVITSAAALIVIVFACFAAARVGTIQQIGLGLTTAILIDATVVRCLLVPATMTLLGKWNWWAPAPLRRLHARIGLHDAVLPPPPSAIHEPQPAAVG